MRRGVVDQVTQDLDSRIVLLSGPRQVGKTTLARSLFDNHVYLNHDHGEHRLAIMEKSWDRRSDLLVLDEVHKKKDWKRWLKGIYDVEGIRPRIIVTGSARLDLYRKVGDSLAGRYFHHRLHPFDVKEVRDAVAPAEAFELLMRVGGFPEPFLDSTDRFYKRWRRSHIDIILRQDLLDLEAVRDIQGIETLVELLRSRVGSTVSWANLARDVERDPKTVKRWVDLLQDLYVVFKVTPYSRNIARSLLKEPKIYFYDNALVLGDVGSRLENLVACALHKELDLIEDRDGEKTRLHFLRTRDGREVDFAISVNGEIRTMLEVKSSRPGDLRSLIHFGKHLPKAHRLVLVSELDRERTYPDGTEVRSLVPWLATMELG